MQYFKNTELAKIYPISEKAVRNWVKAAKNGQLELALHETESRSYIANTAKNLATIEKIVKERKKYANKLTHKNITPKRELYEVCTEDQIFELINSIEVHRELSSLHWNYGQGAQMWEAFMEQQRKEGAVSIPKITPELLSLNQNYIDYILSGYSSLNIVCIGAEVFTTLKDFLLQLSEKKIINRLVLIDENRSMLAIARQNVKNWFGSSLELETVERDMRYERFNDILRNESLKKEASETLNLYLLLGSTIYNFRSPEETLKMIHHSLGPNDIFLHDVGLDARRKRRFDLGFGTEEALSPKLKSTLDLLNIDDSYYTVERYFDKRQKQRFIRINFDVAVTLTFQFNGGERVLHLNKGESLTIFRYWHQATSDVLRKLKGAGFNLLHASHTKDREYLLTISSVVQ